MTAPIVIDERGYAPLPGKLGADGWLAFIHNGVRVVCEPVPQSDLAVVMILGGDLDDPAFEPDAVAALLDRAKLDELIDRLTAVRAELSNIREAPCRTEA